MKKTLFLSLTFCILASCVDAQTVSGGFRRAGTNAQIKAMHTGQLADSLNLSEDQAKNVDAIQQDFMLKMRAIKLDTQLSDTARKSRLQELQNERKEKLKKVMTEQQLAKMDNQKPRVEKTKMNDEKPILTNTQTKSKKPMVRKRKTTTIKKHKHTIKHA